MDIYSSICTTTHATINDHLLMMREGGYEKMGEREIMCVCVYNCSFNNPQSVELKHI